MDNGNSGTCINTVRLRQRHNIKFDHCAMPKLCALDISIEIYSMKFCPLGPLLTSSFCRLCLQGAHLRPLEKEPRVKKLTFPRMNAK